MKYKAIAVFIIVLLNPAKVNSQGKNHNWLIGYDVGLFDTNVTSTKVRLHIDSNSLTVIPETRNMPFRATQGNISDENGNLIIASNGCWIANATGDTMLNGSGLNVGMLTSWCDNTTGMPLPHGNVVLPFPGDTSKYILFHQNAVTLNFSVLYYSIIDMTLDGGLGAVVQKNIPLIQDSITWGIAACKHANGRDWWVVALKDNSNLIYKILVTPNSISIDGTQNLNTPITPIINACQPTFSMDGTKFAYSFGYTGPNGVHDARIFNFDRCTGYFDSLLYIPPGSGFGFGICFSQNSDYFYHSSFQKIYQVNLTTFSQDTVAINDGFYSPYIPFQTDFWYMYLAANGKIYISSGNGVIDMHVINSPDSPGLACDVQQHSLHLPCFYVRGNVLHPNYYLGPVLGSVCDTLGLGIEELQHDFHFSVSPNPSNGNFKISYLLPQNERGILEIFDINGRRVYEMNLPQWSTMQVIELPNSISSGIYNCAIRSQGAQKNIKVAVIR